MLVVQVAVVLLLLAALTLLPVRGVPGWVNLYVAVVIGSAVLVMAALLLL